tara:strand:- start:116 stop:325 length:210 start_codon:yes stop_codon:yes gene_type:complete
MKVTVDIDDQHYEDFLELLKTLSYARPLTEYEVPQWQQDMVMERAEKIDRGEMKLIEVDEALSQIFDEE